MNEVVDTVKKVIHEEFEDMERNYTISQHKIEILDQENRRLANNCKDLSAENKELQVELDMMRKTSDKYKLLDVLRRESSYLHYLHFVKDRKKEMAMLLFWHDAESFRQKFVEGEIILQNSPITSQTTTPITSPNNSPSAPTAVGAYNSELIDIISTLSNGAAVQPSSTEHHLQEMNKYAQEIVAMHLCNVPPVINVSPGIKAFIEKKINKVQPHSNMFMMLQDDIVQALNASFKEFIATDQGKSIVSAMRYVTK